MWFGIFIVVCIAVIAWDWATDPNFTNKMKELEED